MVDSYERYARTVQGVTVTVKIQITEHSKE